MNRQTVPYELDLQLGSSATIEEILAASSNLSRDANGEDEVPLLDHAMEASSATEPSTLLEEIIMITASGGEELPSLPAIADQAAPSGSNVEHLGSDDPQAAMAAGARQESN